MLIAYPPHNPDLGSWRTALGLQTPFFHTPLAALALPSLPAAWGYRTCNVEGVFVGERRPQDGVYWSSEQGLMFGGCLNWCGNRQLCGFALYSPLKEPG